MPRNRRLFLYLSCAVVPLVVVGCAHSPTHTQTHNAVKKNTTTLPSLSSSDAQTGSTKTKNASSSSPSSTKSSSSTSTTHTSTQASGSTNVSGATGNVSSEGHASQPAKPTSGVNSPDNTVTMQSGGVKVTFDKSAWKGLGTAALVVSPQNKTNRFMQLLYVITDGSGNVNSSAGKPTLSLLSDHAAAAKISPTGRYVAVLTSSQTGGTTSPMKDTLWLMAADGSSKQKLSTNVYSLVGDWLPHTDTFVYADTDGKVYSVTPGLPPKQLQVNLGKGQTINAVKPNPQNSEIAFDVVIPDGSGDATKRHDKLVVWNSATHRLKTLVTAKQSNGFDIGPWTNDGQRLFYWLDPGHSSSIAADGLSLFEVNRNGGKPVSVGETLTGKTVLPVGGEAAVIQSGSSRFLYDKKTIQLWEKRHLGTLTQRGKSQSITQFEPDLSPDGTSVSFVEGSILQNQDMAGQSMYDWWNSLQIVTANLQTGKEQLLSNAGHGVSSPHYGPGGNRVIFLKGDQLDVTTADNTGGLTSIFKVDSTTQSYGGQWGFTVPLDITDYVR